MKSIVVTILVGLADGMTVDQVAARLEIGRGTLYRRLREMADDLSLDRPISVARLVAIAAARGWIKPEEQRLTRAGTVEERY